MAKLSRFNFLHQKMKRIIPLILLTVLTLTGTAFLLFIIISFKAPWLFTKEQNKFQYNDRFQKIDNKTPEDKIANEFIDNNVSSLLIGVKGTSTRTAGTTWSFALPSADNDFRYYFATNLHVVSKFIEVSNNRYSLKPKVDFFVNRDPNGNPLVSDKVSIYQTLLKDVKLETVGLKFNSPEYNDVTKFQRVFSDFVVLSSSNNPFGAKPLNFSFSLPEEASNSIVSNENLYIGGYPSPRMSAIDYTNPVDYLKIKIPTSTSNAVVSSMVYTWRAAMHEFQSQKWGNYTRNIIIDDLNLGNGSSGSPLFTVVDNKIKILGIYWGGLSSSTFFAGTVDLLCSDQYRIFNDLIMPGYDNTKINPTSLIYDQSTINNWNYSKNTCKKNYFWYNNL